MKALWLEHGRLSLWPEAPLPQAGAGEALVRVRLAGVCGTDLELTRGYYPFVGVPGHEFVGEIAEAYDAPQRVGERVVGEINLPCGVCRQCRAGRQAHCEVRRVLGIKGYHGAFAEYLTLPLANLHRVPDTVPDSAAVFTEPLAAAVEIQQQVSLGPTDRVLVVGAGRLGQLIALVLKVSGCRLQVVARHTRQRRLLEDAGILWLDEREVPQRTFDRVVEASGDPAGFILARRALRPRGTMIMKSTYSRRVELDLSSLVVDEITVVGSRCGPIVPALELLEQRLVVPQPLIDGRFSLADGEMAMAQASRPGALKVLLECR